MGSRETYTYIEVCQQLHLSEELLLDLLEHGIFHAEFKDHKRIQFNQDMIKKIQSACRLQRDLEINTPGVVLILELMDEISQLQQELSILSRHF